MKFVKMHGIGNDYIYIDCFKEDPQNLSEMAVKLSDRHYGIGSDGIICIRPSKVADACMQMLNSDGSESAMCGNGVRCVGKYVYDSGIAKKDVITIETKAGIKILKMDIKDGKAVGATVDMGEPQIIPELVPIKAEGKSFINKPIAYLDMERKFTAVSMGNPHIITYVDDVNAIDIEKEGPALEHHDMFPERTNIEFIQVVSPRELIMRVWERGSGETLACGTGACAVAVSGVLNGINEREVLIHLRGGDLKIRYDDKTNRVFMTGNAVEVFRGEVEV